MITRRGVLRLAAGGALGGAALGGYAFGVEPGWRLRVQRWRPAAPLWPQSRPLTIAMIADPHAGAPLTDEARLERVVARVNAVGADLIALLGDYAASHRFVTRPIPVETTARIFAGLRAPLGVYAVLGNHDWWDDRDAQRRGAGPTLSHAAFEDVGIPVLENDAFRIDDGRGGFWLLGLGDQLAFLGGRHRPTAPTARRFRGVDDLPGTLAQIDDDAPAILLAHEPDVFPEVPDRVALTLSGHTHGGQVRLFGWSPLVPSRFGGRYAYGVVEEGGRTLVVSGGIGCSVLPVRFGVPPEITVVDLG